MRQEVRFVEAVEASTSHQINGRFKLEIARECFDPGNTIKVLRDAVGDCVKKDDCPTVMTGAGVENVNNNVDALIDSGLIKRVIAQTELNFSNSMIGAWWRVLKHQWLFLNSLDSVAKVERLVEFYVEEHNVHLPHTAFSGQTPDEMYFGRGEDFPEQLKKKRNSNASNKIGPYHTGSARRALKPLSPRKVIDLIHL